MSIPSPYHAGERAVQQKAGEAGQGLRVGRVISDSLSGRALAFMGTQTMVIVGSVDPEADVWASVLFGEPGFMRALDSRAIEIDLDRTLTNPSDPLWDNIANDARIGLLMIDLKTRGRLRVNGRLETIEAKRLRLNVEESYPNCPKYIQRRRSLRVTPAPGQAAAGPHYGHSLDPASAELIGTADTLFVASAHPVGGVDASHRGGNPGFVRVIDDRTLRIPDYPGNSMFNTLGNFAANARAGLLFLDFERSALLQLVGRPEMRWDLEEAPERSGGTGRYWDFEIERTLSTTLPFRIEWEFLDYSPFNPEPLALESSRTGS